MTVTHGDGTHITYQYRGRATETTDENGVTRIAQTDAFGRPTSVCEISANTQEGDAPSACGTDIAGTGFVTSYAYNLASHLTTVTQGVQTREFQTDSLGRSIATSEPERGITTYTYAYNSSGLQVVRTRPKANQVSAATTTTTTQYDAIGRPLSIIYSDGTPEKGFSYDAAVGWADDTQVNLKGRLSQESVATSAGDAATNFSYDPMGRTAQMVSCRPSTCGKTAANFINYTYDLMGNMLSASDGAGVGTGYVYSLANEIVGIGSSKSDSSHPATLVSNVMNGPDGPLSFEYGNGLYGVRQYNPLGLLDGGWVCSGSSAANCSGGTQLYGYSLTQVGGRINQVCDALLGPCANLGYDGLDRLTSRTAVSGTTLNNTWTYDRYGNRWTQTATQGANPSVSFDAATNHEAGFAYDAAGNMTSDGIHTYSYDAEGDVTAVDGGATAAYSYDAMNRRIRTVVNGVAEEFVFNAAGQRVSTWNASNGGLMEENAYWGSLPLTFDKNGALHFQHQDWEGTERLTTSYSGVKEGAYGSAPFGDGLSVSGSDLDPYHFAQLDQDYESGLEHAQARSYSSAQAHWMSPDPYDGSYDWSNPQSYNRYSYVENNPLGLVDPSGRAGEYTLYEYAFATPLDTGLDVSAFFDAGLSLVAEVGLDVLLRDLFAPQFHGTLQPRPNSSNNSNSLSGCQKAVANAVNKQFGTNLNASNVLPSSNPLPQAGGEVNVNFSVSSGLSAAQFNAIQAGRYAPQGFWGFITGNGSSLHVVGAPSELDPNALSFAKTNIGGLYSAVFTAHIDSAWADNPIGAAIHYFKDVLGSATRQPCPASS